MSDPTRREAALEMSPEDFRVAGHALVDRIAEWMAGLREGPVTREAEPRELRALLPPDALPEAGRPAAELLAEAAPLVFENSLFNAHPKYMGYITAPAAPIGILAELLAAAINPSCGGWELSKIAAEIERQAVRWIAQLLRFPDDGAGLFVSGGNAANFHAFLAARAAKCPPELRERGLVAAPGGGRLLVYASDETHTWIQKALDLFGHGVEALRSLPIDAQLRADPAGLSERIRADRAAGDHPFLLVATTGTLATGAVDPLRELAAVAREEDLWLHADGAYGAPAACLSDAPPDLHALGEADSVAVDPHEWLYSALEAGVVLVKDPRALDRAFGWRPSYYHFELDDEDPRVNFYAQGLQSSRGFRALETWLGIRQAGREGIARMIADDCALARRLFEAFEAHPEFEAMTCSLSITTARWVPPELAGPRSEEDEERLDELNDELLTSLKRSGEAFLSKAVIGGRTCLRSCMVNFRTTAADVDALPAILARHGREAAARLAD